MYAIASYETTYRGTRFRSRLEARWAAFFDLVGWRWEYEPLDLLGWTPDFVLPDHGDLLVEVVPAIHLFDRPHVLRGEVKPAADMIRRALPSGSAAIFGAALQHVLFEEGPELGVCAFYEPTRKSRGCGFRLKGIFRKEDLCRPAHPELKHHLGSWGESWDSHQVSAVTLWWAEAGNRVRRAAGERA